MTNIYDIPELEEKLRKTLETLGWEDIEQPMPAGPDEIYGVDRGTEEKPNWYFLTLTLRTDKEEGEFMTTVGEERIQDALSPTGRDMMGMIPKEKEKEIDDFLIDLRWYLTQREKLGGLPYKLNKKMDHQIKRIEGKINSYLLRKEGDD